jgi:predicted dehydrogenase
MQAGRSATEEESLANGIRSQQTGRILIAGYGSIGRRHVRNLQSLGCSQFVFYRTRRGAMPEESTAGASGSSDDKRQNGAAAASVEVTDLDSAFSYRPQIAVVSNPSAAHIEVALAAARRGCDLFIEKPLSDSLAGCDELRAIVREKKLVAMIGCQFRFHPLLIQLRQGLQDGKLGIVAGARAEWGEYLPDWHPWEDHRTSYSARADLGGGVILTLIHPLDYMYWLFGPTKRVQATTRPIPSLQTPAGEDWAEITIDFQSGVVGQVHLDYLQRPAVHRLTVWGDRGRAEWDYHAGTLRWETHGIESSRQTTASPQSSTVTLKKTPAGFERNTMFVDEMRYFLDCVKTRQTPAIPLSDGIAVLEMAMAAKRSAASGLEGSIAANHG